QVDVVSEWGRRVVRRRHAGGARGAEVGGDGADGEAGAVQEGDEGAGGRVLRGEDADVVGHPAQVDVARVHRRERRGGDGAGAAGRLRDAPAGVEADDSPAGVNRLRQGERAKGGDQVDVAVVGLDPGGADRT